MLKLARKLLPAARRRARRTGGAAVATIATGLLILIAASSGADRAQAAPCDPSPPYGQATGNWFSGFYTYTDASYMGGIYGQLENYNPIVPSDSLGYGTVAWVGLSSNTSALAQVGWLKTKTGARNTFIQGYTSGGKFTDIRNLAADPVDSFTYYDVEYNPGGNPYFKFTKNGAVLLNLSYNYFVPNEAQVATEITDYGDQNPGDGQNWMGFYDLHKWHWGYWTEMAPPYYVGNPRAAVDGMYYGTTYWTRDTYCN